MPVARDAIVLGAGIAGLAAAIALDRAGYRVEIIERAASIDPIGAALSLWGNAMVALRRLGVADAIAREAAPIAALGVKDAGGRWIMRPVEVRDAFLPTRTLLQRTLHDHLGARTTLRLGTGWTAAEQDERGVTVRTDDGETTRAALLIDASGLRSPLADRLLDTRVSYRGYAGVLGIGDVAHDADDRLACEYWGDGARFGLFDVGDGRRYWFYMRDAPEGAPAPSHDEIAMRAQSWPREIGAAVAATGGDRLIPFAIHARDLPTRLGAGRIVCVGDAAHAMEPNLGQGGCQGLEDAVTLGEIAADAAPEAILRLFERARLRRVRTVMRQSHLAARFVHPGDRAGAVLRGAMRLIPGAVHARGIATMHRA